MYYLLFNQSPHNQWRITIPTLFTLARLFSVVPMVMHIMNQQWGMAGSIFVAAACTDFLDGALARFLQVKTFLGACLDALADKVLLFSCFVTLSCVRSALFVIPHWFVMIVLIKELVLIAGYLLVYFKYGVNTIQPTLLGKTTTCLQLIFIAWVLLCYFFHWIPVKTYGCMLTGLTILSVLCLLQYAYIAHKNIRVQP